MRFITVLLCLTVLCTAVFADATLRYNYKAGELLKYDCTSIGAGVLQAAGTEQNLQTQASFVFNIACPQVDAEGNMLLQNSITELDLSYALDDQVQKLALELPSIQTLINPAGQVLDSEIITPETGPAAMQSVSSLILDVQQFFGELQGPIFPLEAVKPGQQWSDRSVMTTADGQEIAVTYTTTLLDFATLNEHNCARLQTQFTIPLQLGITTGGLLDLTGTHYGTTVAYFDYQQGRLVRSDSVAQTRINMSTPQEESNMLGMAISANLTLDSQTVIELRPEEAAVQ